MRATGRGHEDLVLFADRIGFFSGLRALLLAAGRPVRSVQYLAVTRCGRLWVRLLERMGREVKPLAMDLSSPAVKGGSLWDRVHLEAWERAGAIVERLQSCPNFLDGIPAGIPKRRRKACLRKLVQQDIYRPLMLALYAGQAVDGAGHTNDAIVLAKLSDLAPVLQATFGDRSALRFVGYPELRSRAPIVLAWFLARTVLDVLWGVGQILFGRGGGYGDRPTTVAVQFDHGVEGDHPGENDLWWIERSGLTPERCLVYFDRSKGRATDEVIDSLRKRGYRYRILNAEANGTSNIQTQPFPRRNFRQAMADLGYMSFLLAKVPQMASASWQVVRGLKFLIRLRGWQNLMEEENIKVVFNFEESSLDVISPAADLTGGVRVGWHWSALVFPSNSQILRLHQVYFVWGHVFRDIVMDGLSACSEVVPQSGCIYGIEDAGQRDSESRRIREGLATAGVRHVVCLLDRTLGLTSNYGGVRHVAFFDSLLKWAESDLRVGFVVKFKDRGTPRVYRYSPDIASRLEKLVVQGRAVLLDGSRSVVEGAEASDVVVALGYNSGGVITALTGSRTVFWDPTEISTGPFSEWYRGIGWTNPDIVFSDLDALIDRLRTFFDDPSSVPGLGDMSAWLEGIDGFQDGRADMRIGSFARWFMGALEKGLPRDEALHAACSEYRTRWGHDKVDSRFEDTYPATISARFRSAAELAEAPSQQ